MEAPALPWAAVGSVNEGGVQQHEGKSDQVRLDPGERIRVLWEIQGDDGQTKSKWWGASVKTTVNSEQMKTTLSYDAHEDFEAEEAEVEFCSAETLRDCSTDSELHWMKEIDYDEDADSEEEGDEDEVIDVQDLCRLTGAEGENGVAVEAEAMQQLQSLPMDKQLHVAEGFRNFVDHLSGQLKAKAEASGGQSYVVTEADVHEIMGCFRQK